MAKLTFKANRIPIVNIVVLLLVAFLVIFVESGLQAVQAQLVVDVGLFIDVSSTAWSTARSTTIGGKTVTLTDRGVSVRGPTGSAPFHQRLPGHVLKYMFFGSGNFLLILDSETGLGDITHRVTLIDFTKTPPSEKLIISGRASSTAVPPPNVQFSQGTGSAFLVFNSTGTEVQNLGIYRSDNGTLLCAGPPPFVPTGEIQGEGTGTEVKIHYSSGGMRRTISCLLPSGNSKVQPTSQTFPDAVVGGHPSLASTTRQFTIRNTGNDRLVVKAIGNNPPFFVASTSTPLPASLNPGQMMTVNVIFSPNTVGTFGPTNLPITLTPDKGDNALIARGKARSPTKKIGFSSTALAFGEIPLGSPKHLVLQIRNDGETDLNVSLAAPSPESPFQWSAFDGVIPFKSTQQLTVTFTPRDLGSVTGSVSISSDATASPSTITLSGVGFVEPKTVFDFIQEAPLAKWKGGSGLLVLPWNGSDTDQRGFAKWRDNFLLEDDTQPARVLQTHPKWINEGRIVGEFTLPGPIQAGDRFKAQVGFLAGAGGEVEFVVEAIGQTFSTSVTEITDSATDGALVPIDADLSSVEGATVVRLAVLAGSSSGQDWAVWKDVRIERGSGTFFDFIQESPSARWASDSELIALPWDGSDTDQRGFAKWRDNFLLEDDTQPARVLQTHPQWADEGYIVGEFTLLSPVQAGDRFKAQVGFLAGAGGEVEFVVEALGGTSGGITRVIGISDGGQDGALRTIDVDLSSVQGATVIRLVVNAGPSSGQDWAVWKDPRIEH
jgi:hypothetical protein